jgi:hypothetical protein
LEYSQKCQYALRAFFELALRYPSENVTTVAEIAEKQQIPLRFSNRSSPSSGPEVISSHEEAIREGM